MKKIFLFIPILFALVSCGTADTSEKPQIDKQGVESDIGVSEGESQLNINILWDLSDRIDNAKNPASPQHYQRDIEAIKTITELFKKDMRQKGAYKAKSRIRVFFSPSPDNAEINSIAKSLNVDLASFKGTDGTRQKKMIYDSITQQFERNTSLIYHLTVNSASTKSWDGSDIWRFFKNDVKDYCVAKEPGYRNILVLITDGYIYHKDSKERQGNRTSYILPEVLKPFRSSSDWKQVFSKNDYGLITKRNDLADLEILVLEITPSTANKNDEDYIKAYLEKWFREMGVKSEKFRCYNTNLPTYTRDRIADFFKF